MSNRILNHTVALLLLDEELRRGGILESEIIAINDSRGREAVIALLQRH